MKLRDCVFLVLAVLGARGSSFAEDERDPFFIPRPDSYGLPGLSPQETEKDQHNDSSPNLVREIGTDLKNVFTTKENLVIVSVGLGAAWAVSHLDERVAASRFNSEINGGTTLDRFFEPAETLGGGWVQGGGALALFSLGKLFTNRGVEELGRDLIRAQIVNGVLTQAIKHGAGRERPDGANKRSFPSGHASGAFTTATVLQRRYGWKAGIPAYAVAGYVASSRLNEGRHYLSDVVFGAAVGILSGCTVTIGGGKARFALLPMVTPAGAGVQVAWVGSPEKLR